MNKERADRIRKNATQSVYVDLCFWFSTINLREKSLKKLDFCDNRVVVTCPFDMNYYIILDSVNNPMKMEYFAQR